MAIFGYLTLAFKVWMFVDALRRRVPFFWYLVLTFPFGEVIYFAAVKARDFGVRPGAPEEERKPSPVVRLERVAEESPSFHNRTQLAWALMEEKQPERAQHYFEHSERFYEFFEEMLEWSREQGIYAPGPMGRTEPSAPQPEPIERGIPQELQLPLFGGAAVREALKKGGSGEPER